ncbi:unnamed protein product, partial [Mesorhabditis spiculigera]
MGARPITPFLRRYLKTYHGGETDEECIAFMGKQLDAIRLHRIKNDAPVDTMGCHMLADLNAPKEDQQFQALVGAMLSPQTKDEVTFAAMKRFRDRGCTVEQVLKMSASELEDVLKPVGFYKKKALYVLEAAKRLKEQYGSQVPDSVPELCKFPGVGLKIANLVVQTAHGRVDGIVVDTHVDRISKWLGWTEEKSTPAQVGQALEALFEREHWADINKLMVGLGQTTCKATKPDCANCKVQALCPKSYVPGTRVISSSEATIDIEDAISTEKPIAKARKRPEKPAANPENVASTRQKRLRK